MTGAKEVPSWNNRLGRLSFRGRVIRCLRSTSVATNIVAVLDKFEEEIWDELIEVAGILP
jgi:hypothetical protein